MIATAERTIRGVYKIIEKSPLQVAVGDFTFYFTSDFNYTRFKERYQEELIDFNRRAQYVYRNAHHLEFDELGLIRLYQTIEKRGFYLTYKGVPVNCPENITFKTELLLK